jgi:hypothetical protein
MVRAPRAASADELVSEFPGRCQVFVQQFAIRALVRYQPCGENDLRTRHHRIAEIADASVAENGVEYALGDIWVEFFSQAI